MVTSTIIIVFGGKDEAEDRTRRERAIEATLADFRKHADRCR